MATTRAIADAINALPEGRRPGVLVSTSAVGAGSSLSHLDSLLGYFRWTALTLESRNALQLLLCITAVPKLNAHFYNLSLLQVSNAWGAGSLRGMRCNMGGLQLQF